MTRVAKKKTKSRAPNATIGRVRKGAGGVTVEYVVNIIDNGAPEYFVTDLCRVEKLGPGTVRISWGSKQEDGTVLVVYKAIMDLSQWLAQQRPIDEARAIMARLPPDGHGGARREAH